MWSTAGIATALLVVTQVLAMLQSAALAVLALTGTSRVATIIALSVVQGLINAFDMPARQAFVVEMVDDREDLPNAIALNSSMVNGARLIGPSVAGVLIAAVGEGWCFAIDAVSYLAVIASLLADAASPAARRAPQGRTRARARCARACATSRASPPIRAVLLLLALVSLMGMPYTVLMPVFATKVLHGGPHTLGFLMAASGVGALARRALPGLAAARCSGLGRVIADRARALRRRPDRRSRSRAALWLRWR